MEVIFTFLTNLKRLIVFIPMRNEMDYRPGNHFRFEFVFMSDEITSYDVWNLIDTVEPILS